MKTRISISKRELFWLIEASLQVSGFVFRVQSRLMITLEWSQLFTKQLRVLFFVWSVGCKALAQAFYWHPSLIVSILSPTYVYTVYWLTITRHRNYKVVQQIGKMPMCSIIQRVCSLGFSWSGGHGKTMRHGRCSEDGKHFTRYSSSAVKFISSLRPCRSRRTVSKQILPWAESARVYHQQWKSSYIITLKPYQTR